MLALEAETTQINSGSGSQRLVMRDSTDNDAFTGTGGAVSLTWSDGLQWITSDGLGAADRVRAISAAGGTDTLDITAIDAAFEQLGDWLTV